MVVFEVTQIIPNVVLHITKKQINNIIIIKQK